MARGHDFRVQVCRSAEHAGQNPPKGTPGLAIVLVDESARSDGTKGLRERLRLPIPRFPDLGGVHEGESDASLANVQRIAVHDGRYRAREESGAAAASRVPVLNERM